MKTQLISAFVVFFGIAEGLTQESNYWTMQYGARATLLGGAVVCGFADNSAMFYNPAALARVESSALSLNTDAYRYAEFHHKEGAGTGLDLVSKRMSLFPQMASGLITKRADAPFRIGFSVLTRYQHHVDISQRVEMFTNVIPQHPQDEYYIGEIDLRTLFSDTWLGICGAFRINEHWSVGATLFMSYRNHRYNSSIFTRATFSEQNTATVSSFRSQDEVRLNVMQFIPKIGIHGRWRRWRIGLTLTAPSTKLWGETRATREISFQNLKGNSDILFSDQQKKIPSSYRYPFSVATGIGIDFGEAFLGVSGEFFAGIPLYRMVQGESRNIVIPTNLDKGPIDFLSVWHYARPIANVGFGYEQTIHRRFKLHLGFRTDFTYRYSPPKQLPPDNGGTQNVQYKTLFLLPSMNLFHVSAGASWQRQNSLLTFGVDSGWGVRQNVRQFTNLTEPNIDLFLQGVPRSGTQLYYYTLTFLVGYTYYFSLQ